MFVCLAPTGALTCGTKFLSGGSCVAASDCPTKTYAANHLCTPCTNSDAASCKGSIALTCATLFLSHGACVAVCPVNQYGLNHVCSPCVDVNALTCSPTAALTCGGGLLLYQNQCIASCPSQTFTPDNVICAACSPNALTCGVAGGSQYYLQNGSTNTCVTQCPAYFFNDASTSRCTQCADGAATCLGAGSGQAVICGLNGSGTQTYLDSSQNCVVAAGCAAAGAFFPSAASGQAVCTPCAPGVLHCNSNAAGGATVCGTSPSSGAQLFLDPTNNCVVAGNCPAAFFPNTADNKCDACAPGVAICDSLTNAYLCNAATPPLYLDNVFECASCSLIDPQAKTCNLALGVLTCSDVYSLRNHFDPLADLHQQLCAQLLTCANGGPFTSPEALSCGAPYYIYQISGLLQGCTQTCPSGTMPNLGPSKPFTLNDEAVPRTNLPSSSQTVTGVNSS
ncbi:hypothetical protein RQP46_011293 [Phenoliferia psychrophenolica]